MTTLRTIAMSLLFAASLHAFERPLTPTVHGPAMASQYAASAASDGESYLVLWIDQRAANPELWGTRVARDGRLLDPTGIRIADGDVARPFVAWTGTSYLAAWASHGNMKIVRVMRDGAVVDGPVIGNASPESIASNGAQLILGYTRANDVRALVLTPDGEIVRDLHLATEEHHGPRVAWNGATFAAVWTSFADTVVRAIRFDANGVLDSAPRTLPADTFAYDPQIASDGDSFVVTSTESFYDGRYAARQLNADLSPAGPPVMLPGSFRDNTSLLWLGTHYGVIGESANDIFTMRLGRDAQPLDAQPAKLESPAPSGTAAAPAAATNGSDVLIAWNGALVFDSAVAMDTSIDVFATMLSASTLRGGTRTLLSRSAAKQIRPALASGGTNLLAVWSEASGLYAERLRLDGSSIDAAPLRLSDTPANPVVAFNGSDYIVAWYANRYPNSSIFTRRVARDGSLRADGGAELRVPPRDTELAIAGNGNMTLLVMGPRVSRLASDGSFIDSVPLELTDTLMASPAVAADDRGGFLVTWTETHFVAPFYDTPIPLRVRAARIVASFTNADPGGFSIAEDGAGDPALTWNGNEWLVVWSRGGIEGRRISRDGILLGDTIAVAGEGYRPNVAWDGSRYAVTWDEWAGTNGRFLLHAAWLPQLGSPLTGERFLGEIEFGARMRLPLVALAPDTVVTAYARIAREPEFGGVTRAFVNVMNAPAAKRRSAHSP